MIEYDASKVGTLVTIEGRTLQELKEDYNALLAGAVAFRNPGVSAEIVGSRIERIMDWLSTTDFYNAPASTIHHESFVGGLLVHTLNVYNNVVALTQAPQFKDVNICSAVLVALVHDWCKIGLYESYQKNVKNQSTGQWEQVDAFRKNQTGAPLGHGVTSMFLIQKMIPDLTLPEACAIRWHMSTWRVADDEKDEIQKANEDFQLVHLIQFADQLSITNYANTKIFIN